MEKYRKFQREWIANRRKEFFKDKFCTKCGSTEKLHLHHIDPKLKIHHAIWSWSKERRDAEIKKCEVLCAACHIEHHAQQHRQLIHGTYCMYSHHKCRCDLCKEAKRIQSRKDKENRLKKLSSIHP